MTPEAYADYGPPPPYTRQPLRPSRSVPNFRRQQDRLDPGDVVWDAFPGVDAHGRLRSPSPAPSWESRSSRHHVDVDVPGRSSNLPSRFTQADVQRRDLSPSPSVPPRPPESPHGQVRPPLPTAASEPVPPAAVDSSSSSSASKEKNFFKTAFDETVFFAGGLLPHPTESTRHFTILRHTPALVWYRGPSTSVTMTIFSDEPLPSTRSLWLQRKGYSGDTGMALKSLVGATNSWVDVTPSSRADVSTIPATDERAFQRDITKFVKKASGSLKRHIARETHIVRVPATAEDGYFRLVLCCGDQGKKRQKKVLCTSPIFRVASTSTDASMIKGASLSTMPIELGVKVGSAVANTVVNKYVGPARMAATAAATGAVKKVERKGVVAARAREMAVAKAGLKKSYNSMESKYGRTRGAGYAPLQAAEGSSASQNTSDDGMIGPDQGPIHPFPIKFDGKVCPGTGRGGAELGIPTANLTDVSEDLRLRMRGVYMAWACVVPKKGLPEGLSHDWHEALVTVGPSPYAQAGVVAKNVVTVHLIHEFGGCTFFDAKLKVLVMGQLRRGDDASNPELEDEETLQAYANDVMITVSSLSRDAWGPVETRQRMKTLKSERCFAERYVDARDAVQKQVDRVPMHWAGVRSDGAAMRDRTLGAGGIWIQR